MKLQCNHCGLIIESGLSTVGDHISNTCEAIYMKPINDTYSIRVIPKPSFTPIEDDFTKDDKSI